MSLSPGQPQPSPEKPKLSTEERRARQADRLKIIRLRMAIRSTLGRHVVHRTSAYKNNRLEQDHRGVTHQSVT